MNNVTTILIRKALKSSCRYRVAAIALDKRGVPLAYAMNSPRFSKPHGGEHAEIAVMKKVSIERVKTILIARVNKAGDLLPIHPCETCERVATKYGIKIKTIA